MPAKDAPASIRDQAIAFAKDHLQQLVGDLIHWRRKGVLPAGSLMTHLSGIMEPDCASGDSMQQAEYIVSSLALQHVADQEHAESLKRRLEWAAQSLRDIADRGRAQLGDAYPEVLQVLGTVRTCLESLGDEDQAKASTPHAPTRSVNLRLPVTPSQAADLTMQIAEAHAEGRLPLPAGLTIGFVGTASSGAPDSVGTTSVAAEALAEKAGEPLTSGSFEVIDTPLPTATRRSRVGYAFKVLDRGLDRLLKSYEALGVYGQPNTDEGRAWLEALETVEARLQPPPSISPDRLSVLTRCAFEATNATEHLALYQHWYQKGVRAGYSVLHDMVTGAAA